MTDHRAEALRLIQVVADLASSAAGISAASGSFLTQTAIVHALLAVESRIVELVEQQRLAGLVAALESERLYEHINVADIVHQIRHGIYGGDV